METYRQHVLLIQSDRQPKVWFADICKSSKHLLLHLYLICVLKVFIFSKRIIMVPKVIDLYLCYLLKMANETFFNGTNEYKNEFQGFSKVEWIKSFLWPFQLTLCVISALVSLLNLAVLTRPAMKTSSINTLFIAMETSNMVSALVELCVIAVLIQLGLIYGSFSTAVAQIVALTLVDASEYFTNWLAVVIAAWRLVAVSYPLKASTLLTKRRTCVTLAILACLAGTIAAFRAASVMIKAMSLNICSPSDMGKYTVIEQYFKYQATWVRHHHRLWSIVYQISIVVCFLLPCVCLFVITILLVRKMRSTSLQSSSLCEGQSLRQKSQRRTSIILMILLWCFISGSLFMGVSQFIYFYIKKEFNDYISDLQYSVDFITNSFSFVCYYNMGFNFRESFHNMINSFRN